jgi:hypothetical protein
MTYIKHKSRVQIQVIKYINHMNIYLRFEIDLQGVKTPEITGKHH